MQTNIILSEKKHLPIINLKPIIMTLLQETKNTLEKLIECIDFLEEDGLEVSEEIIDNLHEIELMLNKIKS